MARPNFQPQRSARIGDESVVEKDIGSRHCIQIREMRVLRGHDRRERFLARGHGGKVHKSADKHGN